MGGKQHIAPRTSSYYSLQDAQVCHTQHKYSKAIRPSYDPQCSTMLLQGAMVVPASNEIALDVSSSVDTQMASPELQEAASLVSDHVNRLAGRVHSSLASSDR